MTDHVKQRTNNRSFEIRQRLARKGAVRSYTPRQEDAYLALKFNDEIMVIVDAVGFVSSTGAFTVRIVDSS